LELHLESKAIRKLFHFLVWSTSGNRTATLDYEINIITKVTNFTEKWKSDIFDWFKLSGGNCWDDIKQDYILKSDLNICQIFIASHSNVLINEILNLEYEGAIYQFSNIEMSILIERLKCNPDGYKKEVFETRGHFTQVKKINTQNIHNLLFDLGCKGSDLLQANGIIWVEGPSDVIYIRKWLEMYAKENSKKIFTQGIEYEFQMYGGALLDSLCLIKNDNSRKEVELKKLVSMFSFSRNAFVVLDSDAVKKSGKIIDNSNFQEAKQFIKNQFDHLDNSNLGLWYKKNQTNIRTIENYIPKKLNISTEPTKKLKAQNSVSMWEDVKLNDFKYNLKKEIEILYGLIEKWNSY
jgi:hypothetical protein